MATEPKTEKRSKKGEPTLATLKSNGKRKIKKDGVSDKAPIARSSSSNSQNHESNGAKSASKSSGKEQKKAVRDVIVIDDSAPEIPAASGIDVSNKKKKKEVKEGKNKKIKDETEEKDGSLLYQIPMNRVIRIIKSEDPNVRITQEAVYVINKASEKFLQVFATEAYASAFLDSKKNIDYKHLSSVVCKRKRFDFLADFVPEKVKAEDALKE